MDELLVMHHATCARKALIVLLEKGAPVKTREVEREYLRSAEYRRLNENGLVPTLVLADGRAMTESSVIMRYLDEAYDGPFLQPQDAYGRARCDLWLKMVDEHFFPALGAITVATFLRKMIGVPADEAKLAAMLNAMTDYRERAMREDCIRKGTDSPYVAAGLARLRAMLQRIETTLGDQQWLVGDELTLADCAMMPIMLRMAEFGLADAWESGLPRTTDWWRRLASRPSSQRIVDLADKALLGELVQSIGAAQKLYLAALR